MHNALFKFNDPSTNMLLTKFKQECLLNSAAKHPNIVQYIHTYMDPETNLPVLLMELCDESLTRFLERSESPLPYHLEMDLSNDIAQALSYLHSNGVIHRDLTSNNVLLIAERRAKVTDFGMSKLISVNPRFTPLSLCPGNALYMSPEALRQPPQYSMKLDCFSWGVLAVQTMTRLFPNPGPQFNTVEESDGRIIHEVIPEHKRRQSHIDLVDPKHPLLELAIKCLHFNEKSRPSANDLCVQMAALCRSPAYEQSKQAPPLPPKSQGSQKEPSKGQPKLREEMEQLQAELQQMSRELSAKDRELRSVNGRFSRLKDDLEASEDHAEAARQSLMQRDETISILQQNMEQQQHIISTLRARLDEDDGAFAPSTGTPSPQHVHQVANHPPIPPRSKQSLSSSYQRSQEEGEEEEEITSSGRHPQSLRRREPIRQHPRPPRADTILEMAAQDARDLVKEKIMKLNVRKGDKAPEKMARGSATSQSSTAYFACFSSNKIHHFQCLMGRDKWGTLPKGPYVNFGLVMVNGFVTTVGGSKTVGNDQPTNTLLSLVSEGSKRKWVETIPPMPTPRQEMAVVSTEHFIVVMGGRGVGGVRLDTVEIFRHEGKQWSVAGNLPTPLTRPTATICGEDFFVGSGSPQQGTVSKAVFCSTMSKLLSPYYAFPASNPRGTGGRQHSAWRQVAGVQADHYTLCTLSNRLIAVGGVEMSHCNSSAVRKYDPDKNDWEVVGHVNHGRCLSLVTALGVDTLVVVGGLGSTGREQGTTNMVEIAKVCYI
jgi:serine/threonine protein kinase